MFLCQNKNQTNKISYSKPISLVTCLYKIIAKVLSRCLHRVLHETIYISKGAFVEGRPNLDAILIANEVVDEKRCLGEEEVIFKILFEKAYDHVSLLGIFGPCTRVKRVQHKIEILDEGLLVFDKFCNPSKWKCQRLGWGNPMQIYITGSLISLALSLLVKEVGTCILSTIL